METRSKTRQVKLEIQFEGKKRITTTKLELKKAKEKRSMWEKDMQKAVAYCKEHNVRGGYVIRNGICKLIKDKRSINKRLDGISKSRKTREDSRILTVNEEEALVRHLKNKNRAMQGMNRRETTDLIKKMLLVRLKFNKKQKGGRKYMPLSTKAKRFLKTNNLSKTFWNRLEVYHPDLTRKRQGTASSKRVFACTEEAVRKYFDELAAEMIEIGIFTQASKEEDGVWKGNIDLSRVFNHDEMPQFIDYGVSSNASNELVYCGTGDRCQKMKDVNRECVTIEPFVSLDGKIYCYHVIFPGTCIVSSMAPESAVEKIPNLLVSTTDSGYQDGRTCLASYKNFAHAIKEKCVKRPVLDLTDGHSSRFDIDVMEFCEKEEIRQFVSIPDATELLQLLDQCFGNLHRAYTEEKDHLFEGDHVSREGFMTVLASVINKWISKEIILKAASRVGITEGGISIYNLQKEKFARVEAVSNMPCATSTTIQEPTNESPTKLGLVQLGLNVPNHVRAGSREYYKESCKLLLRHANTPVNTEEISEMLQVVKKEKPGPSKVTSLTQVHGSLTGKAILSKVKQLNEEKKRKEDAAMEKKLLKEKKITAFIRCEIRCVCDEDQLIAGKCVADGLRKCSVCGSILKGDCTKKNCKNAGRTSLYPASSSKRRKTREIAGAEGNEGEIITFDDIDLTIDITDNELYV